MESTHIEMRNLDSTIDEKSINTDRKIRYLLLQLMTIALSEMKRLK